MEKDKDFLCPQCGIRQYGLKCGYCDIPLETEEENKSEDEDDEYDWREKR